MSFGKDLRGALQDVVVPDLKAVIRGLDDLRAEVRDGNALLRSEMINLEKRTAERIAASEKLLDERIVSSEKRTAERLERIHDAVTIADLKRRNEEMARELEQFRSTQQMPQQASEVA